MSESPDAIVLPALETQELDEATLDQLFYEIERSATVLAVLLKGAAESLAEGGDVTLAEARACLRARTVRGVQLRYRFAGVDWWDTLLLTAQRVRIVRMRAPAE